MRAKSVIVLDALMKGTEIIIDDRKYSMCEDADGKKVLGIECVKYDFSRNLEEKVFLPHDISLSQFLEICEKMSDGDVFAIGANSVLQQGLRR